MNQLLQIKNHKILKVLNCKLSSMKKKISIHKKMRRVQQQQYNSLMEEYMKSGDYHKIKGDCTKQEPMKYTGTLVKGIATMHKSNAVPVISQEEATDIANMRRN